MLTRHEPSSGKTLLRQALGLWATCCLACACSINYGTTAAQSSSAPEFVFYDMSLTRVEKGKPTATITADALEQYGGDNTLYAKNISFELFDTDGATTTQGSCDLFIADRDKEVYTFLNAAAITSYDHDMSIVADNLQWNNKTEQMVSQAGSTVTLTIGSQKGTDKAPSTIQGTGFSVNGTNRSFVFTGEVGGTLNSSPEEEK